MDLLVYLTEASLVLLLVLLLVLGAGGGGILGGLGAYKTVTFNAACRACCSVSATTIATGSPP